VGSDSRCFVGREAELAVLARAAADAAAGRRRLVVVSGPAGIGKTRLCEQAARRAEAAGFRVVWGRGWPWPAVPGEQPTMVVLDDLPAADEGALLLTRVLAQSTARARLLVVLTCRRPVASLGDDLLDDLERDATVVRLGGFDLHETAVFLKTVGFDTDEMAGGGANAGRALVGALARVSGGSPLLLSRVAAREQASSRLDVDVDVDVDAGAGADAGPGAGPGADVDAGVAGRGVLARAARGWAISADGRRVVLPDLRGVRHLAVLLERPGEEVSALELCGAPAVDSGRHELADHQAVAAYRRRLRDLDADLAGADPERALRLRLERDAIHEHLTQILGLAGRSRAFATSAERARTAVRKAIKRAIDTITAADADLGAEVNATIITGFSCRHEPDTTYPRRWAVHR